MLAVFGALWFLREKAGRGRAQSKWKHFSRTTGNEAACFLNAESFWGFEWQLSTTGDEMKAVECKGPTSGSGNPRVANSQHDGKVLWGNRTRCLLSA